MELNKWVERKGGKSLTAHQEQTINFKRFPTTTKSYDIYQ